MPAAFGTSGLRGLVVDLTDAVVADHVRAFLEACDCGPLLLVGRDLRDSSPHIANVIARTAQDFGIDVLDCGGLPTPALAFEAQRRDAAAIMVTGSHIPADRNGLKFYARGGEIGKADETAINAALGLAERGKDAEITKSETAAADFVARYVTAFGAEALNGKRFGVYSHSAVGRDLLADILRGMGAEVVEFGRSEDFIPVDTEAIEPELQSRIVEWASEQTLDAILSTDGDSDRPMLADETGEIVKGDVLGQISAAYLEADAVVTPVSSNSGVMFKGFEQVIRCKIGSPYVIAAMKEARGDRVVGYEANGGLLLGFDFEAPEGMVAALPTRDAFLPIVTTLISAADSTVSERVAKEPGIFTAADRLKDIPTSTSRAFLKKLVEDLGARIDFLSELDCVEQQIDLTDGMRIRCDGDRIIHLRPSGNAPELRCYAEAQSPAAAEALLEKALSQLQLRLT